MILVDDNNETFKINDLSFGNKNNIRQKMYVTKSSLENFSFVPFQFYFTQSTKKVMY
jgi:hypothetical protein